MLQPKIDSERGARQATLSKEMTELNARASDNSHSNASVENADESRFLRVARAKPMFAIKTWERLYAGALLETDTVRLSLLILLAEEAILDRYIELNADVRKSCEIVDLRRAIIVLSELTESKQPTYGTTKSVD